jgi:beta-galactosidase
MESFKSTAHKAFNGLCLAVLQAAKHAGVVKLTAAAEGLPASSINITMK